MATSANAHASSSAVGNGVGGGNANSNGNGMGNGTGSGNGNGSGIANPPGLQEATKNSTVAWQRDLEALFRNAKDRFPDVVWELTGDDDRAGAVAEEVWGHKAIVYARAPPSFQSRYFAFRPNAMASSSSASPLPYASSPPPGTSALSLPLSRTPSPTGFPPSAPGSVLRLSTSLNPALFANELEYLYTGQGLGEAFDFLFDSADPADVDEDSDDARIDKLRKDLVFMWRSRLYSDVRIALTGHFASSSVPASAETTAIFSSHRFVLVSRSPYFADLLAWPSPSRGPTPTPEAPPTLTLPSPPFTPASLHFTLGFLYTGTLVFSHRTYDLSTAFALLRAALYLSLPSMHDEAQARIVYEMLHGLFHAFLPFPEYERLTAGRWGTGGCRCRQCARRVPRVLEFALAPDVRNPVLERGARRALVGLFGEGWCTPEFAALPSKVRDSLLKGVGKRSTPSNALPLLFASEHALAKLAPVIDPWADTVREMVLAARGAVDEVICREAEAVFDGSEWVEIMDGDGGRFEDGERVEWVMQAVGRGVKEPGAGELYQALVSHILLRPHPSPGPGIPAAPLLPATSHIRVQVEQARIELLHWIGKRWIMVRQERGFDKLEGWALKEIGDYIEVPVEDLLNPAAPVQSNSKSATPPKPKTLLRPISAHPHTSRVDADSDVASSMRGSDVASSMRVSLLRGNGVAGNNRRTGIASSASSVRSVARSVRSTATASTVGRGGAGVVVALRGEDTGGVSPARRIVNATKARDREMERERPDSKLTPESSSRGGSRSGSRSRSPTPQPQSSIAESPPPRYDEFEGEEEDEVRDEKEQLDLDQESVHDQEQQEEEGVHDSEEPQGEEEEDVPPTPSTPSSPAAPLKKTLITRTSTASMASRRRGNSAAPGPRPKSSTSSIRSHASTLHKPAVPVVRTPVKGTTSGRTTPSRPGSRGSTHTTTTTTRTAVTARTSPAAGRPTSRVSVRSTTSTASLASRSTATTTTASTAGSRPTSSVSRTSSRPISSVSSTTESTTFRTANTGLSTPVSTRSRRTSAASSTASVRTAGAGSPVATRARKISSGSTTSSIQGTPGKKKAQPPPVPAVDRGKLAPPAADTISRQTSSRSVRSTASAASSVGKKSVTKEKKVEVPAVVDKGKEKEIEHEKEMEQEEEKRRQEEEKRRQEEEKRRQEEEKRRQEEEKRRQEEEKENMQMDVDIDVAQFPPPNNASTITVKPKTRAGALAGSSSSQEQHKKSGSTTSTASVSTLKRKGSSDTITKSKTSSTGSASRKAVSQKDPMPMPSISTLSETAVPRGATLEIGIPCIISSKRKRFKAYARYIGEVEGELGPWVGVEVPMPLGESWGEDRDGATWEGRQWNDGSWGGVRYFEIGSMGSEWDYGAHGDGVRASRRRRVDGGSSVFGSGREKSGLKREGEQLSVSVDRMKRIRSASPAVSDVSGAESRGLFVRPQQVLYVVDAVGADL